MSLFTAHVKAFAPLKGYQSNKVAATLCLTKREAHRRHRLHRPVMTTVYSLMMEAGMEKTQRILVMSPFKMVRYLPPIKENNDA